MMNAKRCMMNRNPFVFHSLFIIPHFCFILSIPVNFLFHQSQSFASSSMSDCKRKFDGAACVDDAPALAFDFD